MTTTAIKERPVGQPPQQQEKQPGEEHEMVPKPVYDDEQPGCGKLKGKVAIITGGDSGIGRAVAVRFAKEGADIAIIYLDEHEDAKETKDMVEKYGREALLIATDISDEENCKQAVQQVAEKFDKIDILINNAAVQYPKEIQEISAEQLQHTFAVNIFSQFYFVKHAIEHMPKGSSVINTASVVAYRGNETLLDYSATKGAITAFTRSLSQQLIGKGIRVNAVAPGPVWTPLIPASFPPDKVAKFGTDTAIGRAAQPVEIAPCYVFLASDESTFIIGQVLHPNGGSIINT